MPDGDAAPGGGWGATQLLSRKESERDAAQNTPQIQYPLIGNDSQPCFDDMNNFFHAVKVQIFGVASANRPRYSGIVKERLE
jgi:hypothetical protein